MTSLRTAERAWREILRTAMSQLRAFEDGGDFGGLSTREYDVLRALSETENGEARLGWLAGATYLPQPSMSRLVERMERDGLVSRCAAPSDGRGRLVRLTDVGRERYRQIARVHLRSIGQVIGAGLTESEALEVIRLLGKLRAAGQEENIGHGPGKAAAAEKAAEKAGGVT